MASIAGTQLKHQPGRLGNLTAEQKAKLDSFRSQVQAASWYSEKRHTDPLLLRFLRARKFDAGSNVEGDALKMLDAAEKWRIEFKVDELVNFDDQEAAEINKYYPQFYYKTDKDGRPVYIEMLGQVNVKELQRVSSFDRLLNHLVIEYEKCAKERFPACSIEAGHPVETSCTVLDLSGVGISSFYSVKDYVSKASNISQNYYPETMGKFYIINAPFLFATVWKIISGWLDPVTTAKISIFGSSYSTSLLAQIPADNLPIRFGGNSADDIFSDPGPWKTINVSERQADIPPADETHPTV